MKHILICLMLTISTGKAIAQPQNHPIIYGLTDRNIFRTNPYESWFSPNYKGYRPDAATMTELNKLSLKNTTIDIFFGSWCGDSKREVPRFLKVLDSLGFNAANVRLIGLGGGDSLYKQSPAHEEAGMAIYRVPVFIIYRDKKELNRINEYPVFSLEKDLLKILRGESYVPNYSAFSK